MAGAVRSLFSRLLSSVALPVGLIAASFYTFYYINKLPYLIATVLAFAVGSFSIYMVFKYWIDVAEERETPEQQRMRYMIVFIVNLAIFGEIVFFLTT